MKFKLFLKYLLVFLLNNILFGMILGFIWYKIGFAGTKITDVSGIDSLNIIFNSHKYLYYGILFVLEFIFIFSLRKLFNNKKVSIIYFVISLLLSGILYIISSIGYDTGYSVLDVPKPQIKELYIFIACMGLRYKSLLFTFNLSTLLGLLFPKKK